MEHAVVNTRNVKTVNVSASVASSKKTENAFVLIFIVSLPKESVFANMGLGKTPKAFASKIAEKIKNL